VKKWTGTWAGGRTYEFDGRTVYVIEKMHHGRRYSTPLEAGSEREALAELALFRHGSSPDADMTTSAARAARMVPFAIRT
jgi:hypothetical protein